VFQLLELAKTRSRKKRKENKNLGYWQGLNHTLAHESHPCSISSVQTLNDSFTAWMDNFRYTLILPLVVRRLVGLSLDSSEDLFQKLWRTSLLLPLVKKVLAMPEANSTESSKTSWFKEATSLEVTALEVKQLFHYAIILRRCKKKFP